MILKDKKVVKSSAARIIAGQTQEQAVAFFLNRAYKDHRSIFVINDLRFTFNNETAQIDHLIVYPSGFILIESKSINGHVRVNDQGEWSRSYNNKWTGMPSPIKQVELQKDLLKAALAHHVNEILGKMFGLQQGIGGRGWDSVCVVSSNAIIDRQSMPSSVSNRLIKNEFLIDKLDSLMKMKTIAMRLMEFKDARPKFSKSELKSICDFVLAQHTDKNPANPTQESVVKKPPLSEDTAPVQPMVQGTFSCGHCGEQSDIEPKSGKFGYYIKCNKCNKNSSMKQPCSKCQSKKTKVSKSKDSFSLICSDCDFHEKLN
jgi:hypothetical protein